MTPLLVQPLPEMAHCVRSDPEDILLDACDIEEGAGMADHFELPMAPEHITMDLAVQIAVFVYAYARLRMIQFRYDLMGEYIKHGGWKPF